MNRQCNRRSFLAGFGAIGASIYLGEKQAHGANQPAHGRRISADNSNLYQQFDVYVEQVRQQWNVPGIAYAAVMRMGDAEELYEKGFGVKQVGMTDPVDAQTIFQIGSTTKAFTSALVAQLVDAGHLKWDDRVVNHLPDFTMADSCITQNFLVQDLMSQHSGLKDHATDDLTFVGFDRKHIIDSLQYLQPVSSFRSNFSYVNNLFLVAAALVEKYTNLPWEFALKQNIFGPLRMRASTATMDGFFSAQNVTGLHVELDGKIVTLGKDWPFHEWLYTAGPAGSINSNVQDMAQWLRLQLGKGTFETQPVVSTDNLQFTYTPKTVFKAGENLPLVPLGGLGGFYCQGWVYCYAEPFPIVWHTGGTSGCATVVAFVPKANVGIVVLTNLSGTDVPQILAQKFFDLYFGSTERDWSQIVLDLKQQASVPSPATETPSPTPRSSLPISAYAGDYTNDIYGNVTITVENEQLVAIIGPNSVRVHLQPTDQGTFLWNYEAWGPDSHQSPAYFDVQDGQVVNLTVEYFQKEGAGTFKRVA